MISSHSKNIIPIVITIVVLIFQFFISNSADALVNLDKSLKSDGQSRPTIIMIHGMFAGDWIWENYRKYFEERGFRCITPILRYHNRPLNDPPPPQLGTTSLLDYVSDLESEIRKLDQPPIIMGHSMGGLLAQIIASRVMAKSLVLISPAAPWGINAVTFTVLKSAWLNKSRFVFWNEPVPPTFEGTVYSTLHLVPPEEQKRIFQRLTYESGRAVWETGLWLFDLNRASKVDETKVTCPVLVISGSEDRITPAKTGRKIARKYNAAYKEFENHAHWILGESGWEDVAQYIHEWLQSKSK